MRNDFTEKGKRMRIVDWKKEEEKAICMDIEALIFTISDCIAARDASKGWNPENEGYYQDLASVYNRELTRRRRYKTVSLRG